MTLEQAIEEIKILAEPTIFPWSKSIVELDEVIEILEKVDKE